MYVPHYFREERPEVLATAVRHIKLSALVTPCTTGLQISHIPMFLRVAENGDWTLESHVARGNTHWSSANKEASSAAIFQGAQAYISPSWYATKGASGKVVPTWNYIAIHAHGQLEAIEDGTWLMRHLHELTDANESSRDQPWSVDDAPAEYIEALSSAIVGLKLHVSRVEASWKMNQNKSEADRTGVMAGLEREEFGEDVAEIMRGLEEARRSIG
jgi:transcriptional regulator